MAFEYSCYNTELQYHVIQVEISGIKNLYIVWENGSNIKQY